MTNEQSAALVLKDGTGSYFIVSQEALERSRNPAEHTAEAGGEVEFGLNPAGQAALNSGDEDALRRLAGDDVSGHFWYLASAFRCVRTYNAEPVPGVSEIVVSKPVDDQSSGLLD